MQALYALFDNYNSLYTNAYDCRLPLVGVNTFRPTKHAGDIVTEIELIRSTERERGQ